MALTHHPDRARPTIPDGYGLPTTADGMLSWDEVEQRLRTSRHYWLATVRPDGTPHSVPRWGVWIDGRFYYDGAPTTRRGTEVVIVEGPSTATIADPNDLGARLATEFEKYHPDYAPARDAWAGDQGGGLRVINPKRALACLPSRRTAHGSPSDNKPSSRSRARPVPAHHVGMMKRPEGLVTACIPMAFRASLARLTQSTAPARGSQT